ncbi:hypothetical protein [Streptomyces sp. NRRL B-1347]|uniref:hypothetical protein n=1 Tax=Streptomyces sp. NRRL B-1347 TaxID=1476877 RepID=UPI0004CAE5A1|nr:hypothetical protein [Streptomyces sp. NRRL B-1347]
MRNGIVRGEQSMDVVITGLLLVWFLLSVVVQIRRPRVLALRTHDRFRLLPAWNLFAPRPIVSDYFVSFRTWDNPDAPPSSWQRLPFPGSRRLLDGIVNRHRRSSKTHWDSAHDIVMAFEQSGQPIPVSDPAYLRLLGCATSQARAIPKATTVQFRISCIRGHHLSNATEIAWFESNRHHV